jgi:hypothetical protein
MYFFSKVIPKNIALEKYFGNKVYYQRFSSIKKMPIVVPDVCFIGS